MQKKPVQKQKTDQQPDFFQIIRDEDGNNTYMRFQLQQDHFVFHPFKITNQNQIQIQENKQIVIHLPMNRIISNSISDIFNLNKFIYNNSKIINNVMQNGRDMILGHYAKKHFNWIAFLERKQLLMIKTAYYTLSLQDQSIIQYTVLSISNLILKLGINISKLSCILTSKKNTTNFLSIPTLSLLFLQFLMYTLFESKQIVQQLARSQFLRQLPKITYIKFSQIVNAQQLLLMQIGQQTFFTKHSPLPMKNIQYLQFYQKQRAKSIAYEKLTQYQYINAINLNKTFGIQSPYGFEIIFLFRTIYFQIIKDFNPDVIIFVEDYQNTNRIIRSDIRALLISQLMEEVTGKVFVMREIGIKKPQQEIISLLQQFKYQESINKEENNKKIDQIEEFNNNNKSFSNNISNYNNHSEMIDQQQQTINYIEKKQQFKIIQQSQSLSNNLTYQNSFNLNSQNNLSSQNNLGSSSFNNYSQRIMQRISTLPLMIKQVQLQLDYQQQNWITLIFNQYQEKAIHSNNYLYYTQIAKIQEILRDDLSYISLALIQRNSFQTVHRESHEYKYNNIFLQKIVQYINKAWVYPFSVEQSQSLRIKQLSHKMKISMNKIVQMISISKLPLFILYQNYYDYIYDIRLGKKTYLEVRNYANNKNHKNNCRIKYYDHDHVNVYYGDKYMLVFIFRENQYIILKQASSHLQSSQNNISQSCQNNNQENSINDSNQCYFEILLDWSPFATNQRCQHSTYLITDKHIYKGFGLISNTCNDINENKEESQSKYQQSTQIKGNNNIFRANYSLLLDKRNNNNVTSIIWQKTSEKQFNLGITKQSFEIIKSIKKNPLLFQELNQTIIQKDKSIIQIPLIQKTFGWAIFDSITKQSIFMGGYGYNCINQAKLNKQLHICQQNSQFIRTTGKTTNEIFKGSKKLKVPLILFPFIYGIPFVIGNICYILNTNGFNENFTNSNKIFLTQFKMGQNKNDRQYGIQCQRKLFVNYQDDNERLYIVTAKQFIVHYIVNSYNTKNIYQNKCILQTLEQGQLMLQLEINDKINNKPTISLTIKTDRKEHNGFENIKLFFNPIEI